MCDNFVKCQSFMIMFHYFFAKTHPENLDKRAHIQLTSYHISFYVFLYCILLNLPKSFSAYATASNIKSLHKSPAATS